MKKLLRFLGWMFLLLGLALDLLGVLALPDGGLMFAMPYFFLIPGIVLTLTGGLMILSARFFGKTGDERSGAAQKINSGGCR